MFFKPSVKYVNVLTNGVKNVRRKNAPLHNQERKTNHMSLLHKIDYKIVFLIAVGAVTLLNTQANAQRHSLTKEQIALMDSVEMVAQHETQTQQTKDDNRMAKAKLDRKQMHARAKDARRIETDANTAAKESRLTVRAERKAQKSRRQANQQLERAAETKAKSDNNYITPAN
jgi:hypothetical protein